MKTLENNTAGIRQRTRDGKQNTGDLKLIASILAACISCCKHPDHSEVIKSPPHKTLPLSAPVHCKH
eukprot:c41739_g1_i1 orf=8-208(-)